MPAVALGGGGRRGAVEEAGAGADAVVVAEVRAGGLRIENIFRHLEMGKKPVAAARDGALEVGGAVLASTLTTVVVFAPILLIEEQAGQLFRDIALALMAAVSLSLVVSLTVIPVAVRQVAQSRSRPATAAPRCSTAIFGSRLFRILGAPFRPVGAALRTGCRTWRRRPSQT